VIGKEYAAKRVYPRKNERKPTIYKKMKEKGETS
jgi:hypothetical protein